MKLKIIGVCLLCWLKVLDFFVRGNVIVYFDFVYLLFFFYKIKWIYFYYYDYSFGVFGIYVVIYFEFF